MVTQNLVHLKLEYNEAVESRKHILTLQRDSLRIAQTIRNYNELRSNESKIKIKLHSKTKLLLLEIKKLQKLLPKADLPKILQDKKEEKITKHEAKQKKYNPDIKSQLQDIQNKLNSLNA